jgi:short-subunit dehydrogenase
MADLAVVTGASSGIGFELTKVFARNGFDVVMVAEDDRLSDAAARVQAETGRDVVAMQVDLSTGAGVEDLHRRLDALGRPIEALALNAGVGLGGEFVETSWEADRELIGLNVLSVVHLAKLVTPSMAQRGRGRVLITASIASTMPGPYYATYAASKAFVLSFAEAIRHELKPRGVVVTALMPGITDTDFFRRAHMLDTHAGRTRKDDPAKVAEDGFHRLMRGSDHVVAGSVKNKVQVFASRLAPYRFNAAVHGMYTKPK